MWIAIMVGLLLLGFNSWSLIKSTWNREKAWNNTYYKNEKEIV